MTQLLGFTAVSYRYPTQPDPLFTDVAFTLYAGEVAALVGANGSGKTTLLGLARGMLTPVSGSVARAATPYYLAQEDVLEGGGSVLEELMGRHPQLGVPYRDVRAAERQGVSDPLRYADLLSAFGAAGGFEALQALEAAVSALGFPPETLERPLMTLSGGERRRLSLLPATLFGHDLLLLDEPTNHLDAAARAFLSERLQKTAAGVLVVSHDRAFLDEVAGSVLELSRGHLTRYRGNYSAFRAAKEAEHRYRVVKSEKLRREIGRLREQERTYKVWGARKEKEKSGAADKGFIGARAARVMKRGVLAKERLAARADALEREKPWVEKRYALAFDPPDVPSGVCLHVSNLRLERESRTVVDLPSLIVEWGERLAVVGENGAGKTTLLEALAGRLEPAAGTVHWHPGARLGYLPQARTEDGARTLAATLGPMLPGSLPESEAERARLLLGSLGVPGEAWDAPLGSLSDGQQRKAALVRLILARPNVLVLDEPTTHLDVGSIEKLEAALLAYPGTVLLVTHDAYLLGRVATRVLALPGERG